MECYVEGALHEIIDSDVDPEGSTSVPDSDFTISREAYINNTSKYFVNKKKLELHRGDKFVEKVKAWT